MNTPTPENPNIPDKGESSISPAPPADMGNLLDVPPITKILKRKSSTRWKNSIIYGEFIIIVILTISIVTTSILHNMSLTQGIEAILQLEQQQELLREDISQLSGEVTKLKELQFSQSIQDVEESILTYDSDGHEIHVPVIPGIPRHSYDWTSLQTKDGFKNYLEGSQIISHRGVDVSTFQGNIDWNQVKQDGIDFAIIRLGYRGYGSGTILLDEYFTRNIQGAAEAGIHIGVYFFSQAISEEEAIEEAKFVLKYLNNYNITYPVVYDAEEISFDSARTDYLTVRQLTNHAIAFCDTIQEAGYQAMIYGNKKWFVTKLDLSRLTQYDMWLASYVSQPDYPYDFKMWQYTEKGRVKGISGDVDLNISFYDYAQ